MNLGIFFNPSPEIRGPQKVANNLVQGLKNIGIDPKINEVCEFNGCLQSSVPMYRSLPEKTLMGPNLLVVPTDDHRVWALHRHFVVPSEWVFHLYKSHKITEEVTIDIWPVGIDTERFNVGQATKEYDCLLYVKNRSQSEVSLVREVLTKKNLKYVELSYGSYNEDQFIQLIHKSKFCFLLTGTESQGIAYMEVLSTNTPCFVWDSSSWNGYPATSVPYFDARCGYISQGLDEKKFDEFLHTLNLYTPREYILEKHTLEIGAKKYLELIVRSHNG